MSDLKRIRPLSKSESKDILELAMKNGIIETSEKNKQVQVFEIEGDLKIYIIDGQPLLFEKSNRLYPTLFNKIRSALPSVVVDDGAISHILNGADVMAPGIVSFPLNVKVDDLVSVRSQNNKILSIGVVLDSFTEKLQQRKGRVIKNIHYVGDELFKICMKILKV
ncbi:MAG: DUF1947 domain-containing protein [Thermoproteota archaeon]|jgi:Predicted RNA-binding protein (contains PUA domain)